MSKPRKKLSLKDQAFKDNLVKYGYNQTQAYQATYPKSSYEASNAHGNRKYKSMVVNGSLQELAELAQSVTQRYLRSEKDSLKERAKIASPIVTKQYKEVTEGTQKIEVTDELKQHLEEAIKQRFNTIYSN